MSIVQETWDVQFLYLETKINIVEIPGRFLFWFLRWGLTLGMAGPKLKIFLTQPPKCWNYSTYMISFSMNMNQG